MTNAELLAKIKAEIERRIKRNKEEYAPGGLFEVQDNLAKLLSFLSDLESEKPVPNDLAEATSKCKGCNNIKGCVTCVNGDQWAHYEESEKPMNQEWLENEAVSYCFDNGLNLSPRVATDFARHFAQWGAEHLADARKTSPKDLEEAAKRYSNNKHPMTPTGARESQEDFIAGAKWQEEKEKEYSPWLVIPKLKEAALEFGEQAKDYEIGWQSFAEDMAIAFTRGAEWQKEQMMKMITKDDNLEEAGKRYVETYFRDIDWTPDVIKSCLEEAFISGGEYVFKQIKYE